MRKVLLLTVIFDRMIFAGRDESEQHLRGEHFEEYKSLFARECFLKTRHHEKYREWEAQEVYIEGLTFCNLDEMETHGRKLKKKTSLMFDFYPTCLEKNKHVGIFTPRCYFPHMFGF